MPNSDNTFGVFNKTTRIYSIVYVDDQSTVPQSFGGNVETAKSFFFTEDALACWNDNSTQIQWAITDDGNSLKVTNAFGTKGGALDPADDWAGIWSSTKTALQGADNWIKSSAMTMELDGPKDSVAKSWKVETSDAHLF